MSLVEANTSMPKISPENTMEGENNENNVNIDVNSNEKEDQLGKIHPQKLTWYQRQKQYFKNYDFEGTFYLNYFFC